LSALTAQRIIEKLATPVKAGKQRESSISLADLPVVVRVKAISIRGLELAARLA